MYGQVLFWILAVSATLAVFINLFLIFVVYRYSNPSIGNYRWLLIAFALFEGLYAMIVFLTIPIHLINDNSWIVFSYESLLENTPFVYWGPGLYCAFYELWIGLVVVMFIYRYIIVCHPQTKAKIIRSDYLKLFIALLYAAHFVYSFLCGVFWCTRNEPSEKMKRTLTEQFHISEFERMGYMLMRFKYPDGTFSPEGTISILNHYGLVAFSAIVICFCCISIWKTFARHSKELAQLRELNLQRQIFLTLVLQTVIPLLMCHVPTLTYLTFPLWPEGTSFGSSTPIMSVLTTIPKILDPIVTLICIQEYRTAVLKMIRGDFSVRTHRVSYTSSHNLGSA